ncbi:MAG TPA: glycosyltransferase family 4 protein [Kineosporiaceae bacterium]
MHNEIAPYRLPIFEEVSRVVDLTVLFCKGISRARLWAPTVEGVSYEHRSLRGLDLRLLVLNIGVWRELRRARPDVYVLVENHENVTTLLLTALHARLRGRPVVIWSEQVLRTAEVSRLFAAAFPRFTYPLLELVTRGYRQILYRQARAFVSMSGAASDIFLTRAGVHPSKIFPGRQILPIDQLAAPGEMPEQLSDIGPYILFLGYLRPEKGASELIEAFRQADTGEMTLLIAGSGPMEAELWELAGDTSKIRFAGYADTSLKATLMANACALVVPSIYEAWGLVVNEALYYGTPILFRAGVPTGQLVKDGGGISYNGEELVRCLSEFCHDARMRNRLRREVADIPRDLLVNAKQGADPVVAAVAAALKP